MDYKVNNYEVDVYRAGVWTRTLWKNVRIPPRLNGLFDVFLDKNRRSCKNPEWSIVSSRPDSSLIK